MVAVNLNELCDEVNRILKDQKISVVDARTSSELSPRNVRYYQTIGLLHPPTRKDGRADYNASHVEKLVSIKRAQHDGVPLDQMQPKHEPLNIEPILKSLRSEFVAPSVNFSMVMGTQNDNSPLRSVFSIPKSLEPEMGWAIHFGTVSLSGRGNPLSKEQVDAIREILQDGGDDN